MQKLHKQFKDPKTATAVKAKENGKNRAVNAMSSIITTIKKSEYNETETKVIFVQVISDKIEIAIEEIAIISDKMKQLCNEAEIVMGVSEKDIKESLEIQVLFTNMNLPTKDIEIAAYNYLSELYDN